MSELSGRCVLLALVVLFLANEISAQEATTSKPVHEVSKTEAIAMGVEQLLKIQNDDGAWPYEGVYRVNRKIPVGYRIGGTAICCEALMYAAKADNAAANQAITAGVAVILQELEHPLMQPSQADRYDVRVWGHIYALDLFCRIGESTRFPELKKTTAPWISKLTQWLLFEEIESGGWNYANRRAHAGFVTAPAVQALMWARQAGEEIPEEVWNRAAESLLRSRNDKAAFAYSGDEKESRPSKLPGSIARSANCEATLEMLGLPRGKSIKFALDAFHEHWDELEKRRKQNGTHKPPYGVAPYYFYYGHRYAAMAIQQLPKEDRAAETERLFQVILRTRDPDGTWNDRVFDRSRAYGTAMTVLALLEDKVPQLDAINVVRIVDPTTYEPVREPVFVRVDPELVTPKMTVEISSDEVVKLQGLSVELDKLDDWFASHPVEPPPNHITIMAAGETKTGSVQRLKTILGQRFGSTLLYVGIKD